MQLTQELQASIAKSINHMKTLGAGHIEQTSDSWREVYPTKRIQQEGRNSRRVQDDSVKPPKQQTLPNQHSGNPDTSPETGASTEQMIQRPGGSERNSNTAMLLAVLGAFLGVVVLVALYLVRGG